ncbi:hypothetical protein [Butyrivibrio hungatei]|uniref:Uncharacterized protein n=1 Tax=Butyrivibrio hungatei TaxID=185008 RepID=A0A1D9P5H3_9FIRM|nr:hypothetical protein [Butyrivibrio hungatei]AOZ97838.1 hypothetical protein bhn_II039 [Butyrivibrio hungatei]
MAALNILYGFKHETIESSINKEITLRNYTAKSVLRSSKETIKDYIIKHSEVQAVVLKEYLDGGEKYSIREIAELADYTKAVIVVVLATTHRGKNEMKDLYSAGILTAYFSDGKFGADPDVIADLIVKGRGRKEARKYYKIDEVIPDHINLTYSEFRECYKFLLSKEEGLNIAERFVTISRWLYPGQMGAFCDALPAKVKEILMQYREFYDIANKAYRLGYAKQKYKMPRGVTCGITPEELQKKLASESKTSRKAKQTPIIKAANVGSELVGQLSDESSEDFEPQAVEKNERPLNTKIKRSKDDLFGIDGDVDFSRKEKKSIFNKKKVVPELDEEPVSILDVEQSWDDDILENSSESYEEQIDSSYGKFGNEGLLKVEIPGSADKPVRQPKVVRERQVVNSPKNTPVPKRVTPAPGRTENSGRTDYSSMSTEELIAMLSK